MNIIEVGKKAPEFTLLDTLENPVHLSDYRGKKVLLSWHPLAWTSVCTDQMRSLERNKEKFKKLNTVPLGISVDPSASKHAWAAVLSIRETLLLSDFWPHGKVARDYGIFIEDWGTSGRANIIVDEEGIVRWAKLYETSELPDIDEVLTALERI